ncbi:FkbM family methyltransferase [Salidesulfovibrio onnuriiensis]|uniref:FkbM family methyltransferase n=1 Tax=Salidesulfovibrio onnuriiensis TaxID=2583823 RepID=UPI0011C94B0B|nr:FkbM family methyltransferase [Salidesulfovibrio onnuriiensis]
MNAKEIFKAFCGIPRYWKRSRDPHYVKLAMLREIKPRFVPGSVILPFGRVNYADIASLEAQYFAIFISREYQFESSRNAPVILDCGGNIGLSALWFGMQYPGADITVFEPGPDLFPLLKKNLELHKLSSIRAEQVAVWTQETTLHLGNDKADGGFTSTRSSQESRPVQAVRLADRISGPVDLLKLDIEGAEFEVMNDLAETGKLQFIHKIAGELHAGPGDTDKVGKMLSTLHKEGFQTTISYARPAPALFCHSEATPFPSLCDGKYLALFYAWKENEA